MPFTALAEVIEYAVLRLLDGGIENGEQQLRDFFAVAFPPSSSRGPSRRGWWAEKSGLPCNPAGPAAVCRGEAREAGVDRHAFSQVAQDRVVPWRRIAFLICGDWGKAEDIVQTALIRMYRLWHRIDIEGVDSYARQVIARLAIDEAKRRNRRKEVLGPVPDLPVRSPVVDEVLAVRTALQQVPPRQRAVLVLRFYGDLSVAETAAMLRISEGTVKSQCARGLDFLRSALAEPADERQSEKAG